MMLIACPHCGPRAQAEFAYERTRDSIVTIAMAPDVAMTTLFERTNQRGVDDELWRHSHGCRRFILLRRNRVTHEILSVEPWGGA